MMKVLDLNILLYAINKGSDVHTKAKRWLENAFNDDEPVALPWVVILGFLRVSTHPNVFPSPLTPAAAMEIVDGWLTCPNAQILHPGQEHWSILKRLLNETGTAGNLTTDSHLAALAIENGAELQSTDADFGRFSSLSWTNPIR